jgi:hypothetical protein
MAYSVAIFIMAYSVAKELSKIRWYKIPPYLKLNIGGFNP